MSRTDLATVVGSLAGLITVLSFIPQAVRAWRTKRTQDLSTGTFVMLVMQAVGWTTYGVLLGQKPIIYTNSCVLAITLVILAAKLKHG
jgi:MtN3 and saliva related transmembrane protein